MLSKHPAGPVKQPYGKSNHYKAPQSMSKQAPAPAPAPAQAPPPAYGKAAMVDLVDEIDWSACEVLNATGSLQNVLKQGLRDQEGLLLESDADEQATYGL